MHARPGNAGRASAGSPEGAAHRTIRVLLATDSDGEYQPLVQAFRESGFEPLHRRIDHGRALPSAEHSALIEAMARPDVDFVQGHAVDAPRRLAR